MQIKCAQHDNGTVVGLFVGPYKAPGKLFLSFLGTLSWQSRKLSLGNVCTLSGKLTGWSNYFRLAPMSAGGKRDEAVWAAAGLLTSGEMLIEVHLSEVM